MGSILAIGNAILTTTLSGGGGLLPIVVEFEERVIADDGCVEKLQCVNAYLKDLQAMVVVSLMILETSPAFAPYDYIEGEGAGQFIEIE